MTPAYGNLTLAYLKKNIYVIIGTNTTIIQNQNLFDPG